MYVNMQPVQNGGGTAYMAWECPSSGVLKASFATLFDRDNKVRAQHVIMQTTWSKHRTFTNRVDHDLHLVDEQAAEEAPEAKD